MELTYQWEVAVLSKGDKEYVPLKSSGDLVSEKKAIQDCLTLLDMLPYLAGFRLNKVGSTEYIFVGQSLRR